MPEVRPIGVRGEMTPQRLVWDQCQPLRKKKSTACWKLFCEPLKFARAFPPGMACPRDPDGAVKAFAAAVMPHAQRAHLVGAIAAHGVFTAARAWSAWAAYGSRTFLPLFIIRNDLYPGANDEQKACYSLIDVDGTSKLSRPLLIYYEDDRYTFGEPREVSDPNNSTPVSTLTENGFWRFWGPINPIQVVPA